MGKGQITLFIIIGLLLLVAGGLFIYITTRQAEIPFEEAPVVPAKMRPVYDHVTDCLKSTAGQGITRIGLQGGYLQVPDRIKKNRLSRIALDPAGEIVVPYWFYQDEDRSPRVSDMEREIAKFVRDNLEQCTNLEQFRAKVTPLQTPEPVVKLTDDNVVIRVTWPLEIQREESTEVWEDYVISLDVPLRSMWETAKSITEYENEKLWLENLTISWFASDPEIPMDGFRFQCERPRWHLRDVMSRAQRVLEMNLPIIRIENTDHLPFLESERAYRRAQDEAERMKEHLLETDELIMPEDIPADSYEYLRMRMDPGLKPVPFKANFIYRPEFGIQLNAQPRDGSILRGNRLKGINKLLSFVCAQQWHFTYDVEYPVVLQIVAPEALEGRGYVFQMAFPVMIRQNEPYKRYFSPRSFDYIPLYSTEFCDNFGGQTADIRAKGTEPGEWFATEMKDVEISMQCGDRECVLGKTKADEGIYRLRTRMPQGCTNPKVYANKPGYLSAQAFMTDDYLELEMLPVKNFTFDIVKHRYLMAQDKLENETETVENAALRIYAPGLDQYEKHPTNRTIQLVEGPYQYELEIFLYSFGGEVIGGYENLKLNITTAEIAGKSHVTFHTFEAIPNPATNEEKAKMIMYLYEGDYKEQLRPEFR